MASWRGGGNAPDLSHQVVEFSKAALTHQPAERPHGKPALGVPLLGGERLHGAGQSGQVQVVDAVEAPDPSQRILSIADRGSIVTTPK